MTHGQQWTTHDAQQVHIPTDEPPNGDLMCRIRIPDDMSRDELLIHLVRIMDQLIVLPTEIQLFAPPPMSITEVMDKVFSDLKEAVKKETTHRKASNE